MKDILRVKNLNKSYKNFSLTDVSFSLSEGCITGFIGINGAGKLERFSNIAYGDLRQRNRGSAFFTYHNIDGYADGDNKHRSNDTDDDLLLFIKYFLCHRNSP